MWSVGVSWGPLPLNGVEVPSAIRTLILRSCLLQTPDMSKATGMRAAQGETHPGITMVYQCNCVPHTVLGTVLVTMTLKQLGSDNNNQMLQWASHHGLFHLLSSFIPQQQSGKGVRSGLNSYRRSWSHNNYRAIGLWKWKLLSRDPWTWPHGLYSPLNSPGQNTGVGSLSLLQGIFPTQGSNPGLLHCRFFTSWAITEAKVHSKGMTSGSPDSYIFPYREKH